MSTNGTSTMEESPAIQLQRLTKVIYEIPIVGVTPLIANKWSAKAKELMLSAQQTTARPKRAPKDPAANFQEARYLLPDGQDGFPATAFKAAIVDAARFFDGVTMTDLRRMVTVVGEGPDQLVRIESDEPIMREDTPRNANGVADLRYRPQYTEWSATIKVRTIEGQFDINSLFALVDAAGNGGVGEWRPSAPKSKTGTFGMFEVTE